MMGNVLDVIENGGILGGKQPTALFALVSHTHFATEDIEAHVLGRASPGVAIAASAVARRE